MRRWDGKGPYPLKYDQTRSTEPIKIIQDHYAKIQDSLDKMSDETIAIFFDKRWGNIFEKIVENGEYVYIVDVKSFNGLKLQIEQGNTYSVNGYINRLLIDATRSMTCIRTASKTIIDTAVYYTKLFFDKKLLPDGHRVEPIS